VLKWFPSRGTRATDALCVRREEFLCDTATALFSIDYIRFCCASWRVDWRWRPEGIPAIFLIVLVSIIRKSQKRDNDRFRGEITPKRIFYSAQRGNTKRERWQDKARSVNRCELNANFMFSVEFVNRGLLTSHYCASIAIMNSCTL
jgi:hypothetical protein